MLNKIYKSILIILISIISFDVQSSEQFNFDITEIEILENGQKFVGTKRGEINTNNNIIIKADEFEYDKKLNILKASGKVEIINIKKNFTIYTNKITYYKDQERIIAEKGSKAIFEDQKIITAEIFNFYDFENILKANKNVEIKNLKNNVRILSDEVTYFKNQDKITTKGKTDAFINNNYEILSSDVNLVRANILSSKSKTVIKDKNKQVYNLENFKLNINKEELIGENILIVTNSGLPNSDKIFFSSAVINLKKEDFIAKDTKIELHENIFGNSKNNPRLKGVSSQKKNNITLINKGIFTSCQENQNCPPWSIQAEKIEHDTEKKLLSYQNAFLKIYDVPVLYFPKFFHPDPTVKRQTGFLQPELNNSNLLGNSLTVPYYYVSSNNTDYTFRPTFFDKNTFMTQTEFRRKEKNYDLITDFGFTKGYKSSNSSKKKNISHFFSQLNFDLKYQNFEKSELFLKLEKVTNDTYLKIFDANIDKNIVKPKNYDVLKNELKLTLNNSDFNFVTGFESFEDLQLKNSDRYQYVLPYYSFDKELFSNFKNGTINLNSSGNNELKNTNNLRSRIINDFIYQSNDIITKYGLKNNFNVNIKNLNSIGKNDSEYKSSPQIELMSNLELATSYPMIKSKNEYEEYFTPKLSLRLNPSEMKDYSGSEKKISIDNIFSNNRLGIIDSIETGESLTIGFDYKKESLKDINKYFEFKLATLMRYKEEKNLPTTSTLGKKNSNIYGSISNNLSDNLSLDYKFSIDNDLNTFEYNEVNAKMSLNNIVTEFNFLKENGDIGNSNILGNTTQFTIDESNTIKFSTRRNRKLNLTEYYDLVYEYKNDCLVAGIKYKKSYYEDRDLKPSENLFFTITLFPLTTYEQKINQ